MPLRLPPGQTSRPTRGGESPLVRPDVPIRVHRRQRSSWDVRSDSALLRVRRRAGWRRARPQRDASGSTIRPWARTLTNTVTPMTATASSAAGPSSSSAAAQIPARQARGSEPAHEQDGAAVKACAHAGKGDGQHVHQGVGVHLRVVLAGSPAGGPRDDRRLLGALRRTLHQHRPQSGVLGAARPHRAVDPGGDQPVRRQEHGPRGRRSEAPYRTVMTEG